MSEEARTFDSKEDTDCSETPVLELETGSAHWGVNSQKYTITEKHVNALIFLLILIESGHPKEEIISNGKHLLATIQECRQGGERETSTI